MYNYLKLIVNVTLVIGVQIIALWTASSVIQLAPVSQVPLHASAKIEQGYQPSYTIGSPRSSWGSGTR